MKKLLAILLLAAMLLSVLAVFSSCGGSGDDLLDEEDELEEEEDDKKDDKDDKDDKVDKTDKTDKDDEDDKENDDEDDSTEKPNNDDKDENEVDSTKNPDNDENKDDVDLGSDDTLGTDIEDILGTSTAIDTNIGGFETSIGTSTDSLETMPSFKISTKAEGYDYGMAGTYTLLTNKLYEAGTEVNLSATVNSGYNFEGWYINTVCLSTEKDYSYIVADSNVTITAKFSSYTLTTSSSDSTAGTYTIMNKKVSAGEKVTLTATPKEGCNFEGWYITYINGWYSNTELISSELTFEYEMEKMNVTLEARFSSYTVTTSSPDNLGGIAGTYTIMNSLVSVGKTVTLTAQANEGYNFEGWYTGYDNCLSTDNTFEFTMGKESMNIEARFSSYTVTTSSSENPGGIAGTYTIMNSPVSVGKTVTLTAQANEGYTFEGWYTEYDECLSTDTTCEFTMTKKDMNIEARFSSYHLSTIGVTNGDSYDFNAGTFTQYSDHKVSANSSVTLTATAKDGYNFIGWYIDDVCVSISNEYIFTMEKKDVTIEARYTYYTLVTGACHEYVGWDFDNPGLYITPYYPDAEKISVGTTLTLTANDISGYSFMGWNTGDGVTLSTSQTFTYTMSNCDIALFALYAPN